MNTRPLTSPTSTARTALWRRACAASSPSRGRARSRAKWLRVPIGRMARGGGPADQGRRGGGDASVRAARDHDVRALVRGPPGCVLDFTSLEPDDVGVVPRGTQRLDESLFGPLSALIGQGARPFAQQYCRVRSHEMREHGVAPMARLRTLQCACPTTGTSVPAHRGRRIRSVSYTPLTLPT